MGRGSVCACVRVCVCAAASSAAPLATCQADSFAFLPALFGVRFHLLLGVAVLRQERSSHVVNVLEPAVRVHVVCTCSRDLKRLST